MNQTYRSAGVSVYSQHLLEYLGQMVKNRETDHQFAAFTHVRSFAEHGIDLGCVKNFATDFPLGIPIARIGWEQTILPLKLRQLEVELIHGLVNVLPLASHIPSVVTVHDLSFLWMPQVLPPLKRAYLTHFCRASIHKAHRVIAVSQQTAQDIVYAFGTPSNKISVVYNGVDERFQPVEHQTIEHFRQQKQLPDHYLLYVGTLEPRKNLTTLIQAFAQWRKLANPADRGVKLILAGAKGWYYDQIFSQVAELELQDAILFPGYVSSADLPNWYCGAEAFIYPSRLEGFGLPVLEAMACGTPVICSQIPSLCEVVGDAALTFPVDTTDSVSQLSSLLSLIVGQPTLRKTMKERGLTRARHFSWKRTAAETVAVYDSIVH
ncbi:glycosyltransferase family 4 protein [Chloroflexi bacterium TSY]|nr:glycosyltransferase family 4 protein [Chloroflexi bacterium TSY]